MLSNQSTLPIDLVDRYAVNVQLVPRTAVYRPWYQYGIPGDADVFSGTVIYEAKCEGGGFLTVEEVDYSVEEVEGCFVVFDVVERDARWVDYFDVFMVDREILLCTD